MKQIILWIIQIILFLLVFYFGGRLILDVLSYNETRRAIAECEKWADQAKVYPNFYLTKWQYQQCVENKVTLDALILKE